jgi:hypothetical protein
MPAPLEVQAKSIVDGVAGFVTQDAHALNIGAAFDLEHLFSFELHQARMGQVKRDGESRDPVGRKPFRRQPHVRLETDPAVVELAVEAFDVRFEE